MGGSDQTCQKTSGASAAVPAQAASAEDLLAEGLGAAGAAEFRAGIDMRGDVSRCDPNAKELEARYKHFEAKLTQAIGRSAADADRCVKELLRRARAGEPLSPNLPVASVDEVRLRIIRCGGKNALERLRHERVA